MDGSDTRRRVIGCDAAVDAGKIKFYFASVLLEGGGGAAARKEAVRTFQQLVNSLRPYAEQRPRDLAMALTGLAMGLQVQKDYQQALRYLGEATVLLSSVPESSQAVRALILSVQCATHWKLGNHETAQRMTDDALKQFQEILGRDHPAVNYFRVYTARLIHKAGNLDQAESMLRAGVTEAARAYGQQPRTANTMKSLAELLLNRGQLDEAEATCQDALRINTTILGPDSRLTQDLQRLLTRIRKARVGNNDTASSG